MRVLAAPAERRAPDPFAGLGKIAALGIKVSRHCTYHGVALNVAMDLRALRAHRPLRLCRAGNGRSFYNRRSDHLGRSARSVLGAQARPPTSRPDAERHEHHRSRPRRAVRRDLRRRRQAEGRGQDCRASRSRSCRREVLKKPDWIRVKAGSPTTRFYEIKQILREQQAAHGVRGSVAARTSASASARAPRPS